MKLRKPVKGEQRLLWKYGDKWLWRVKVPGQPERQYWHKTGKQLTQLESIEFGRAEMDVRPWPIH